MTFHYRLEATDSVQTPYLLVYPSVIHRNVDRMAEILGGLERLRPHIKTHKCRQVVQLLMSRGINKFKCASVEEVRLLIGCGVQDIQLAYPLVGPHVERLAELLARHPDVTVTVTVDDDVSAGMLNEACRRHDRPVDVLIDLDVGMHRTGIEPGPMADELAMTVAKMSHLRLRGLHAYDGHIRERAVEDRRPLVEAAMAGPLAMKQRLGESGVVDGEPVLSTSGTLTFIVAKDIVGIDELTPGTWVFWDVTYNEIDGPRFAYAALVASRVVCRPGRSGVTLDAGSKGISRDIPGLPEVIGTDGLDLGHPNEEHQPCQWQGDGPRPEIGDVVLLAPRHVCTTFYLYSHCGVVEDGRVVDHWPIVCRHGDG